VKTLTLNHNPNPTLNFIKLNLKITVRIVKTKTSRLQLLSHHMNTQMTNYLVLGNTRSEQKCSTFTCRLGSFRSFV